MVSNGKPFVSAQDAKFPDEMLAAFWPRLEPRRFPSAEAKENKIYQQRGME